MADAANEISEFLRSEELNICEGEVLEVGSSKRVVVNKYVGDKCSLHLARSYGDRRDNSRYKNTQYKHISLMCVSLVVPPHM